MHSQCESCHHFALVRTITASRAFHGAHEICMNNSMFRTGRDLSITSRCWSPHVSSGGTPCQILQSAPTHAGALCGAGLMPEGLALIDLHVLLAARHFVGSRASLFTWAVQVRGSAPRWLLLMRFTASALLSSLSMVSLRFCHGERQ